MTLIYLILILLIIMIIAVPVVMILWDNRKEIKDIIEVRHHAWMKDKLLIDYYRLDPIFLGNIDHRNKMVHEMKWVHTTEEELYKSDYLKAEKWMDKFRYIGVPVFVRLHNFKILDPQQMDKPNKITSSVMYNVYHAQSMKKAISGMTKLQFAPIDVKALGVMMPVIIGIAIGMLYFLGFF